MQNILAVLVFATSIIHCVINLKHESNARLVKTNKILYVIFSAVVISQTTVSVLGATHAAGAIGLVLTTVSDLFLLAEVIIIEGLVDEFRHIRESSKEITNEQ